VIVLLTDGSAGDASVDDIYRTIEAGTAAMVNSVTIFAFMVLGHKPQGKED